MKIGDFVKATAKFAPKDERIQTEYTGLLIKIEERYSGERFYVIQNWNFECDGVFQDAYWGLEVVSAV